MPRKTKESENIDKSTKAKSSVKKEKTVSKVAKSNTIKSKTAKPKTVASKSKAVTKKTKSTPKSKVATVKTKKETTAKTKTGASKKSTSKVSVANRSKSKSTVSTRRSTHTKVKETSQEQKVAVVEYYDLPYRYNQTIVKILAQTPKMLFVYWDISDDDRSNFVKTYGEDFFNTTKPVLIIHNETMNYSFEIDINDFANSWYLHINDANCKYSIELGRRPIYNSSNINTDYIYVSSSNKMDAPNNHILFEKFNPNVFYKNTKTGVITSKDFSYMLDLNGILPIFEFYKKLYDENLLEEMVRPDFANPSSLPSSTFK